MVVVPLDGVDTMVVTLVSLKILSRVCFGAQVNFTFLSADKEQLLLELVEVEALTSGKTVQEGLLLVVSETL